MGQGGAMAIEDAVSIAILFSQLTRVDDIPALLRLYQMARESRVEKVLEFSTYEMQIYPCTDMSLHQYTLVSTYLSYDCMYCLI